MPGREWWVRGLIFLCNQLFHPPTHLSYLPCEMIMMVAMDTPIGLNMWAKRASIYPGSTDKVLPYVLLLGTSQQAVSVTHERRWFKSADTKEQPYCCYYDG